MIKLKAILNEQSNNFKVGKNLRGSQWIFDFIKHEEGRPDKKSEPALKSYKKPGDRWTIGYGHTKGVTPNMTITKQEALKFMYDDLTDAANCVRRMFTRWDAQKLDVLVTQEMFDVLISLVFNSGCEGMLKSDFIQLVKQKKYKEAGKSILSFRQNKPGFSGLTPRRQKESSHFLTNI